MLTICPVVLYIVENHWAAAFSSSSCMDAISFAVVTKANFSSAYNIFEYRHRSREKRNKRQFFFHGILYLGLRAISQEQKYGDGISKVVIIVSNRCNFVTFIYCFIILIFFYKLFVFRFICVLSEVGIEINMLLRQYKVSRILLMSSIFI